MWWITKLILDFIINNSNMPTSDFWSAFWPNFWSSIISGGIIGVAFSWWLAKRISSEINKNERKIENLQNKLRALEKSKFFLDILIKELNSNELNARFRLANLDIEQISTNFAIYSQISLWEMISNSSSELIQFFHPITLQLFVNYYDWWKKCSSQEQEVIKSKRSKNVNAKISEYKKTLELLLRYTEQLKQHLDEKYSNIDGQIDLVNKEIEKISNK